MKTIIRILGLVLLLTGCSQPKEEHKQARWQYRVLEFENYSDRYDPDLIFKDRDRYDLEKRSAGVFGLDSPADTNIPTETLTQLGNDGWELVCAVPQAETIDATGSDQSHFQNVRTAKIYLLFKRQLN